MNPRNREKRHGLSILSGETEGNKVPRGSVTRALKVPQVEVPGGQPSLVLPFSSVWHSSKHRHSDHHNSSAHRLCIAAN